MSQSRVKALGVGLPLERPRGMGRALMEGRHAYIRDLARSDDRLAGARLCLPGERYHGRPARTGGNLLAGRKGRLCRTGILLPKGLDPAVRSFLRLREMWCRSSGAADA